MNESDHNVTWVSEGMNHSVEKYVQLCLLNLSIYATSYENFLYKLILLYFIYQKSLKKTWL